eukprot:TRINITY_DN68975_c0_g1_i1.p1 TRINITY_DN68975_c0_g1~~TRINITY_DN68975_c0_g1_i1.p1  ORF type:complete len:663 (+),score=107.67 TRINITY_DN68975_c0_g1_i1:55-1989(+)
MSDGDVSLAIRRARRANAKHLDLSQRGLQAWPEDIFALRMLESIDLSGNSLTSVDPGITRLERLEDINVSNNKLESLPDLDVSLLPNLRSLVLEGNPVVSRVGGTLIRQLARPPLAPGQTTAKVIGGLLEASLGPTRASAITRCESKVTQQPSHDTQQIPAAEVARQSQETEVCEITAVEDFGPEPVREVAPPRPTPTVDLPVTVIESAPPSWKNEQKVMLKEIERLQARVNELEDSQRHSATATGVGGGTKSCERERDSSSSLPAWLQDSKKSSNMSATLPSRRASAREEDEVSDLRNKLREEERKSKRLEQEVQRLSGRLGERDLTRGGAGSIPHFELSEVDLGEMIAQGGFSVVYHGQWNTTKVAVKKLFDPNISEELLAEFDNEVQKLEQIRHPNILMLLAVHRKPPALSLVTELVEGGSLFHMLHYPSKFNFAYPRSEGVPVEDVMQILDTSGVAIAYIHARGIVHRDVKTQNVLLTPTLTVKLCDFGLARMRSELMTGAMQYAGTPNYMAPELFRNQKYTDRVDVFAFGTMLWESIAVDIPFANLDSCDIRDKVVKGKMLPLPTAGPPGVNAVIKACWTLDQAARPSMAIALGQLRSGGGGMPACVGVSRRSAAGEDAELPGRVAATGIVAPAMSRAF